MQSVGRVLDSLKSWAKRMASPRVPSCLSANFKPMDTAATEKISASLITHYFPTIVLGGEDMTRAHLSTDGGKRDLADHVHGRLDVFRQKIIPWLNDAKPLSGASVLEIGCGTGSSTVALAEQGAKVTAVDVDDASLIVAQDRCRLYGMDVNFIKANATDIHEILSGREFDFIIFFACLEHMTHDERLTSMRNTWDMLSKNALWCVIETPNRLWYFDGHTSRLPFYMWLPDDLAFKYSQFSPRDLCRGVCCEPTDEAMLNFSRFGRGVSFHEFDLAIKKVEDLDVVSSMRTYHKLKSPLWQWIRCMTRSRTYRYEGFLTEVGPKIHEGFFQSELDLIIRKD